MLDWQIYAGMAAARSEYDNYNQTADLGLLSVLSFLAGKYGKLYCFPSQDKIVEILRRGGRHNMSRRTLNRHLNTLVRHGYIKRRRRHTRDARRGWCFKSTLYMLTRRAFRYLESMGPAVRAAAHWCSKFFSNSRVPNLAQHSLPKGNHTGERPKTGAPPVPDGSVARVARTHTATNTPDIETGRRIHDAARELMRQRPGLTLSKAIAEATK